MHAAFAFAVSSMGMDGHEVDASELESKSELRMLKITTGAYSKSRVRPERESDS